MEIPEDTLHNLPEGAVYTEKSGQATASVSRSGKNLVFTATCDSLQQLVWKLEEDLVRIRDELQEEIKEKEPVISPFKWFLSGVLTGIILLLIIKFK